MKKKILLSLLILLPLSLIFLIAGTWDSGKIYFRRCAVSGDSGKSEVIVTKNFDGGYNDQGLLTIEKSKDTIVVLAPMCDTNLMFFKLTGIAGKRVLIRATGTNLLQGGKGLGTTNEWHKNRKIAVNYDLDDVHGWMYYSPRSCTENEAQILINCPGDKNEAYVSFIGVVNNTMIKSWMNTLPTQYLTCKSIGKTQGSGWRA